MTSGTEHSPPSKRRRLNDSAGSDASIPGDLNAERGVDRPISPPPIGRHSVASPTWNFDSIPHASNPALARRERVFDTPHPNEDEQKKRVQPKQGMCRPSPFQLTKITDLAPHQNVNTVHLDDILGDPMIRECWNFNYLFDLDFVLRHFDEDVRSMVRINIVHGFWKRDDDNRIALMEQAEKYPNIELRSAYIPDPFGTHHTKMIILFRHDDTAQVIIHTANMIKRDWQNMTQAVWRSPVLPLLSSDLFITQSNHMNHQPIGSGDRFKVDLLRYLTAYEKRLPSLTEQFARYDFSSVRAAFLGSAPSRQKPGAANPSRHTSFGWLGLEEILCSIVTPSPSQNPPHIIAQISSIATLGPTPAWLSHFQKVLSQSAHRTSQDQTTSTPPSSTASTSIFNQPNCPHKQTQRTAQPKINIIFPTPEEIRTSLDGYVSGGSIHWRLSSAQQQKQLAYMKPFLCHWKHKSSTTLSIPDFSQHHQQAHRGPAAPHIKSYIRFTTENHDTIDWALLTSANLSKQAWGDVLNKKDEIWIQSWEAGVLVWPALFAEEGEEEVVMVPVFGKDLPEQKVAAGEEEGRGAEVRVGLRMPYDLPLSPYRDDDVPWCATLKYEEPDWMGRSWVGH